MNDFFRDENGQAMLLLGLQAHNSSTGTDMIKKTIHAISLYGGNLLEAAIYWNSVEANKDEYDMTSVKELIDEAREANLKLIILWFATSKNGHPTYAPEYIKLNPDVYHIALGPDKAPVPSLSPHCEATLHRDKKAFVEMMSFIKKYDQKKKTVIAVQIENEMGYANTDRDYSIKAEEDYIKPLNEEVRKIVLEDTGLEDMDQSTFDKSTWRGCFGRHAHEAFSAWYHAIYINEIAKAGKEVYDLPLITNVMIGEQGYEEAGRCYNGGAAVGRVLDIWKLGAPYLDMICPDIYNQDKEEFERICSRYARKDNALFIPEAPIAGEATAMNALIAIAKYNAVGFSCFGAESALHNDGTLLESARPVAITMKAIASLSPLLIKYRNTGAVHCFVQGEFKNQMHLKLPKYHVVAHFVRNEGRRQSYGSTINMRAEENLWNLNERGRALLIQTAEDEFYASGAGVAFDFIRRPDPMDDNPYIHISSRQSGQLNFLSVEEGHFTEDGWVTDYVRNGDEANFSLYTHGGKAVRIRLNPNIGMNCK
ncbi:MAG TPA: DUF5597 domain-containing protein [Clostridiales bacterium]|nr:DUF5597 domain-containing protein [Clostridiales bacterium]